jgi:hypothetical protein
MFRFAGTRMGESTHVIICISSSACFSRGELCMVPTARGQMAPCCWCINKDL